MKWLNNFIAWLYIIGTVIIGMLLILSVSGWYGLRENLDLAAADLFNSPTGIWTGMIMILLGLLFLSFRVKAGRSARSISFDNPEGEVTISIKAIEDFVKRVGSEFSQVLELNPTILPSNGGVKISAETTLIAGTNVPRLAESIQSNIKIKMQNILGIENVTGVELHVSKLTTKKGEVQEQEQQQLSLEEGEEKI